MADPEDGWLWAHFKYSDHLNPPTLPDVENRLAVARAYEGFGLLFNTETPDGRFLGAPANTLGIESFSRGLENALRGRGKPWR